MALFQTPPKSPEEIDRSKPLDVPPEQVAGMDEREWYARAFRGDAAQLTWRAVGMGSVLGFFLAFTNVYVGLKTGWALGVALTACIVSFTLWSAMQRIGLVKTPMTILENNCMQSTASAAGYATGNVVVTAIPALLLLGVRVPWWVVAAWVACLAVIGVAMAVPMKRNLINTERLKFPSGTAAAVLLQSFYSHGAEALAKGRALLWSGLAGVLVPLLKDLNVRKTPAGRDTLIPAQSSVFDWLPKMRVDLVDPKAHALVEKWVLPSEWNMRLDHSLVLVAAGAIVGLRTTVSMVAGGLALALFIGPSALADAWTNAAGVLVGAASSPGRAWKEIGIWSGAPLLVAYGLVTFALQYKTIGRAFAGFFKRGAGAEDDETSRVEVPLAWFVYGMVVAGTAVTILAWIAFAIPLHYGALAVFLAFFLALVAARATGETDITPGGPMGKITQLAYGMLMPQSFTANLMTASITSGTALASADLLNDLKSGYLLGAHPRRQFVAQAMGILTGTIATTIGYYVLVPNVEAIAGAGDKPPQFAAPGAQQWKAVAELFKIGIGNLHPMARHAIALGLLVGTMLAVMEWALPKQKKWLPSATGIGLGLLLPFFTSLSFFVGAVAAWIFSAANRRQADRFVVPIASGLIAGESIVGVLVAALNNFVLT